MRPLIFSGTTEGRRISERLSEAGISHIVCVATAYGELVMEKSPYADVRIGRLSEPKMETLINNEAGIVFDATHPYASVVSENIRTACRAADVEYVRVLRDGGRGSGCAGSVTVFETAEDCAAALSEAEGSILLTTGSKDIGIYAADPEVAGRLFVRVLPSEESIRLCSDAGISGRQVIAMQGPFSREMDAATIRQYGIKTLVTKASGKTGGLDEKLAAASDTGIKVFVIGRPAEETGVSPAEALGRYLGIAPKVHIDLIGTGPGRAGLLTCEARDAIYSADMIAGAPRMIKEYSDRETYPYYLAKDIIPVIKERLPERLAVLFSGDSGFYSGAEKMRSELAAWLSENGFEYEIEVHPGISSVSYLASRAGESYQDAALCSMHGRADEANLRSIVEKIKTNRRCFVLMSGPEDVQRLGQAIAESCPDDCSIVLGRDLSYDKELIGVLRPEDSSLVTDKGLYTALVINSGAARPQVTKVLSDGDFVRGKVPMTKENIRHLSLLKLGLTEDAVLYDVGSGTGSVACEAALQSSGIRVYAIEKKDEACALIRENAARLGLSNIQTVCGEAPEAFDGLEAPSHVFIGGSSGRLREIIGTVNTAPHPVRVVINAVSLETMAEIQSVIGEFEVSDASIEQISVSRARELGSHHLMTAENPVMIAAFTLGGRR